MTVEELEYLQNCIDEVVDNLDFDKIRNIMCFLDWKWEKNDIEYYPEPSDMKRCVRMLMKTSYNESLSHKDNGYSATGGFTSICFYGDKPSFRVYFAVEEWENGI